MLNKSIIDESLLLNFVNSGLCKLLQHKTMQMMYETIYKALVEVGLEDAFTPQDYLNFFCLGNREAADGSDLDTASPSAPNTPQVYFLCPQTDIVQALILLHHTIYIYILQSTKDHLV